MGRKQVDTREQQIGQPEVVTMSAEGAAILERDELVVVSDLKWGDKAAVLAFMEEPVTVEVATSSDKFAEPIVEVWNDGRAQRFPRGLPITVKRKFVEVLARAKPDGFGNQEFQDAEGNMNFRYPKRTSLKYPFRVVRDDNPRGAKWLTDLLAETR